MESKRVGVIGGGQLAWMMAEACQKLAIALVVQTPNPDDPAVKIAAETILANINDAEATERLATRCDVITFENEFIELESLQSLAERGICFRPSLDALAPLLDKYDQRCYLQKIGLPVPRFAKLDGASSELGFPVVLKARRHGYDGQGTFIADNLDAFNAICKRLEGTPIMLEEYVPFDRELAIIAARSAAGEVVTYPVVETYQKDRVCHWVIAPANVAPSVASEVRSIASHLLEQLQVVGVFGIELFLTKDGRVLVNEIAPRTHNSGHYTLDACDISQFEMQLRAVAEMPLGSSALNCSGAVMVNLLGYEHSHCDYQEKRDRIAAIPQSFVRWYGKTESRPGRKLGHVTILLDESEQLQQQLLEIAQKIESIWYGDL